jgi:hypothetical protein
MASYGTIQLLEGSEKDFIGTYAFYAVPHSTTDSLHLCQYVVLSGSC